MPSQDEAQEIKQFLVENGLITEDQEPDDALMKVKLQKLKDEAHALEMESARQAILAHVNHPYPKEVGSYGFNRLMVLTDN